MAEILIIEDNPANLDLVTYLLKAFGHTCRVATSGPDGLAEARRQAPDLIICDIQLPGIDGYGVAKQLKADNSLRMVPLVAVSSYAMVGDREIALRAGFDKYISKPINPETFVKEVEDCLKGAC